MNKWHLWKDLILNPKIGGPIFRLNWYWPVDAKHLTFLCQMFILTIIYHVAVVVKIHESPDGQEKLQQHQGDQKERLAAALRWKRHWDEDRLRPAVTRRHRRRSQAGLVSVDHDGGVRRQISGVHHIPCTTEGLLTRREEFWSLCFRLF